jgi:hypothetical protein
MMVEVDYVMGDLCFIVSFRGGLVRCIDLGVIIDVDVDVDVDVVLRDLCVTKYEMIYF